MPNIEGSGAAGVNTFKSMLDILLDIKGNTDLSPTDRYAEIIEAIKEMTDR